MNNDLLDAVEKNDEKHFNKNRLLYALAVLTFLSVYLDKTGIPGGFMLTVIFGGLSTGYCLGLLVHYKQHFWFELIGLLLYAGLITLRVSSKTNTNGIMVYAAIVLIGFLPTAILLRNYKIN